MVSRKASQSTQDAEIWEGFVTTAGDHIWIQSCQACNPEVTVATDSHTLAYWKTECGQRVTQKAYIKWRFLSLRSALREYRPAELVSTTSCFPNDGASKNKPKRQERKPAAAKERVHFVYMWSYSISCHVTTPASLAVNFCFRVWSLTETKPPRVTNKHRD